MNIWPYIQILQQPDKTWFFSRPRNREKIEALAHIAEHGMPSLIYHLTGHLRSHDPELRNAACSAILHLFRKIRSKNEYYDALRHCPITTDDLVYYETAFPAEQYTMLLGIASLNGSGYVREQAVRKLAQAAHASAISFLIYRLADWVLPVREAALTGINNYKSIAYIEALIENLPLFEWLQKVERTNLSAVYEDLIAFVSSANREYVLAHFKAYSDKLRYLLAQHISKAPEDVSREINLFLNDQHFLIRILVLDYQQHLKQQAFDQLLRDPSAKVRLQTLYCLKKRQELDGVVQQHLADASPAVRLFARYTLQQAGVDFAHYYHQNLQKGVQIPGSLSGLAEMEARQYSEVVKKYLNDPNIQIRKTAFLALQKLDTESAYEFALEHLGSPLPGLRGLIIKFLTRIARQEVLEKARTLYQNGNKEIKSSMLNLFSKINGWRIIADLMLGTIDSNEEIRNLSKQYLDIWKIRATHLYIPPREEDLVRARQVLSQVAETHARKMFFRENPVAGMEFYFR